MHDLIILAAKDFIIIPLAVTAYVFWRLKPKKRLEFIVLLIGGGLLSLILAKIGSHLYSDPRPFYKDGVQAFFTTSDYNGFPSDHTLLSSYLGFFILNYSRKAGFGLLLVAIIIGWARVAAHVHHLVDIVGSFICTATVYLLILAYLRYKRREAPATIK